MTYLNRVKLLCSVLIVTGQLFSEKYPFSLILQEELIANFNQEMKSKYGLYYCGLIFPTTLEKTELSYIAYKKLSLEEARELTVKVAQRFLFIINKNKQLRPYLPEFPYPLKRLEIGIGFRTLQEDYPLEGSIARVFLVYNKLFYSTAKLKNIAAGPHVDFYGNPIFDPPCYETVLVDLLNEPYEEALQKVKQAQSLKKP